MRVDTCIWLLYLPLAIFGSAEKNESAFVATHEWQTVKKGKYLIKVVPATVGLLYADRDPSLRLTPRQSNPPYVQPFRGENVTIQSFRHF